MLSKTKLNKIEKRVKAALTENGKRDLASLGVSEFCSKGHGIDWEACFTVAVVLVNADRYQISVRRDNLENIVDRMIVMLAGNPLCE